MDARQLERAAGAVIVPEVRAAGTRPGPLADGRASRPPRAYLERFPPAGVVLFGRSAAGPVDVLDSLQAVRDDARELGEPPPFAACDLEQGAGLHLVGATRLPPALALAAAAEGQRDPARGLAWIRAAGELTAREARARGVELVLAPVLDLDTAAANPIVAARGFGADPRTVAQRALAFHEGLRRGGGLGCAKHFPGHGAARTDSHAELPRIDLDDAALERGALVPFRALAADGIACTMVGHLDVPALTGAPGQATSLSRRALVGVLRGRLGFAGVVLSDAMDMGALSGCERPHARALAAGCDGLLCPRDAGAAAEELLVAVAAGELSGERLIEAAARMHGLREAALGPPPRAPRPGDLEDPEGLALSLALRSLCLSTRRWAWRPGRRCEVLAPLHQARGEEARASIERLRAALAGGGRPAGVVLPVVCEQVAGSGTYGPDGRALAEIDAKLAALRSLGWPVGLVWMGSPRTIPCAWWERDDVPILVAHAPTPPMAAAVARYLAGRGRPGGSLPVPLG